MPSLNQLGLVLSNLVFGIYTCSFRMVLILNLGLFIPILFRCKQNIPYFK